MYTHPNPFTYTTTLSSLPISTQINNPPPPRAPYNNLPPPDFHPLTLITNNTRLIPPNLHHPILSLTITKHLMLMHKSHNPQSLLHPPHLKHNPLGP